MQQFSAWAANHWVQITAFIMIFVQISPIKVSPLTWLGKQISNLLVGDIRKSISEMKSTIDENEKDRIRWEVLDFANSCRNGRRHTKDEFQHIIDLHDKYERLLKKTDDTNGVFSAEYDYIKRLYAVRQEKNDFL